jgi:two-component system, NtrC family, response regulator HydG
MSQGANVRALVVDDEPSLLVTLAANLELAGFDVVDAQDPLVALEIARLERFDLVLSDIKMPRMNGVQLFREIRGFQADLPVVLMTAFAVEALVEEAIQAGVYTILSKPFDIDHMVAALARAARRPAVLILEGTNEDAERVATALDGVGMRCRVTATALEAVEAAKTEAIDVCLVDVVHRPVVELMDRIREVAPSISFIGLEGRGASTSIRGLFERGAFACLRRPFDTSSLVALLAKVRARPAPAIAPRVSR